MQWYNRRMLPLYKRIMNKAVSLINKRVSILLSILVLSFIVVYILFDRVIFFWTILIGVVVYFEDKKIINFRKLLLPDNFRKVFMILIFSASFFCLRDVGWKSYEWLKFYIDSGTVFFILFLISNYVLNINKSLYHYIIFFAIVLIPIFVILDLPIIADIYAVFAFLLVTYLVIKEIVAVRHIQVANAKK